MIHYILPPGNIPVTCHKNSIVTFLITSMLYYRNITCLLGCLMVEEFCRKKNQVFGDEPLPWLDTYEVAIHSLRTKSFIDSSNISEKSLFLYALTTLINVGVSLHSIIKTVVTRNFYIHRTTTLKRFKYISRDTFTLRHQVLNTIVIGDS